MSICYSKDSILTVAYLKLWQVKETVCKGREGIYYIVDELVSVFKLRKFDHDPQQRLCEYLHNFPIMMPFRRRNTYSVFEAAKVCYFIIQPCCRTALKNLWSHSIIRELPKIIVCLGSFKMTLLPWTFLMWIAQFLLESIFL